MRTAARSPRPSSDARIGKSSERGFTLLELTIALTLLALLSAVLFGSLRLAGRSTDGGQAKVDAAASMRLAQDFLRTNLEAQHPLRMRKILESPLLFSGTRDELRYAPSCRRASPAAASGSTASRCVPTIRARR